MPRDIVLGNGELLVNLDRHLSIRDIYYPYVGWANHVGGYRCRIGVWVQGGGFAWLDDSWEWQIKYAKETLVTDCTARNGALGIRLRVAHTVLHDQNVFLQRFHIENLHGETREVRLFFGHDLRIDESDIGDTAFFDPYHHALLHYKRNRYFLFAGQVGEGVPEEGKGIAQYACGEKGFRGAEGTWRDAEDGNLSGNAIAQGSVDSVIGYSLTVPGHSEAMLRTWMVIGQTRDEVAAMQTALLERGFEGAFLETSNNWWAFVQGRRSDLHKLPPRVAELFARSLLIIRTQADKRGAILASNDTDIMETARAHYSYLWPRDGALVSYALDLVGVQEVTRPFFEFCARVLPKDRATLMHKYGPDETVGASWHPWVLPDGTSEIPFQEDGTALVIWALWQHHQKYQDKDFLLRMYHKLLHPAAEFLASYRYPETGLPRPSWDLWEERRGTHLFTVAAVYGALQAAAQCAIVLEDKKALKTFQTAANEIHAGLIDYFWDESEQRFARMVTVGSNGEIQRDMTVDASAYALFAFGVLPAEDPKVVATMEAMGRKLWVRAGGGGLARYERDYYFRVTDDFEKVPGNPWIICTLWLADWYIATAKNEHDLKSALDLLEWASICALRTGVLSEQVHPFTLQPLSVAPLTWSHAQFIQTAVGYLNKLEECETRAAKQKKEKK